MKIHLVSLIAADLDYDIIDFWIEHYKKLKLDTYTAFLHYEQSKKHPEVKEKLEANYFLVKYAFGAFQRGLLRLNVMNGFCCHIPDNDFILSVDSDEFQEWPRNNVAYALNDGGIDAFYGQLIDCYSNELKEAVNDIPLRLQYPYRYIDLEIKINPKSVCLLSKKICVARNKLPVDFLGSHDMSSLHSTNGVGLFSKRDILTIRHYRWRASLKERWIGKNAYSEEEINKMMEKANSLIPE